MSTSLIIKGGRFSYLFAFTPRKNEKGESNWSTSFIIPKNHPQIPEIKKAIAAEVEAKWPDKSKRPNGLHNPLRDGDADRPNDSAYKDSYFINCNAREAPTLLDAANNKLDGSHASRWTSGDYGHVKVDFYPFVRTENKGIGVGLVTVKFTRKGEPLSNRTDPMDGFDVEEVEGMGGSDEDIFG
jgi:hypothetical protein